MEYTQWINEVRKILLASGDSYPIDEQAAEFKEDFEQGLTPQESADMTLTEWDWDYEF